MVFPVAFRGFDVSEARKTPKKNLEGLKPDGRFATDLFDTVDLNTESRPVIPGTTC